MKILAKGKGTYIVECTDDELANLVGYYYASSANIDLSPGTVVEISKMYRSLYHMSQLKESFERTQKTLDFIKNTLEIVEPITTVEVEGMKR